MRVLTLHSAQRPFASPFFRHQRSSSKRSYNVLSAYQSGGGGSVAPPPPSARYECGIIIVVVVLDVDVARTRRWCRLKFPVDRRPFHISCCTRAAGSCTHTLTRARAYNIFAAASSSLAHPLSHSRSSARTLLPPPSPHPAARRRDDRPSRVRDIAVPTHTHTHIIVHAHVLYTSSYNIIII